MNSISKPQIDSLHEVIKIWVTLPKNVTDVLKNSQLENVVSMVDNNKVFNLYFTPETGNVQCDRLDIKNPKGFSNDVNIFIPLNAGGLSAINDMIGRRWLVIYQTGNDYYYLMGYKNGLHFSYKKVRGGATSTRAGYQVRFSGDTIDEEIKILNPFS